MGLEHDRIRIICVERISTYFSRIVWFSYVQTKKCSFGFRKNTSTFLQWDDTIWKREVSQRFFVYIINCHLRTSLFENFSVLQRMIVYGWIEIFFIFVFLFQKIRLFWHSLMCFEAKSAMDNKLSSFMNHQRGSARISKLLRPLNSKASF